MSLSAVFKYMVAKQAVDCRNMVVSCNCYGTSTPLSGYSKITVNVFNVLYAYFMIGPNVRSHYGVHSSGHP